jgi:hypothetical protein
LLAGQPEFPTAGAKSPRAGRRGRRSEDEIELLDAGVSVPREALQGATAEERDAAFFSTLRAEKVRKEEEERQREEAKLANMTPEERAEYETAKAEKGKHESRKQKMLDGQLRAYGASKAQAVLAVRGRGRGGGKAAATRGGRA